MPNVELRGRAAFGEAPLERRVSPQRQNMACTVYRYSHPPKKECVSENCDSVEVGHGVVTIRQTIYGEKSEQTVSLNDFDRFVFTIRREL
jgi:hypothetical protein